MGPDFQPLCAKFAYGIEALLIVGLSFEKRVCCAEVLCMPFIVFSAHFFRRDQSFDLVKVGPCRRVMV